MTQTATEDELRAARARRVWVAVAVVSLLAVTIAALAHMGENQAGAATTDAPAPKAVRVAEVRVDTIPLIAEYRGELVANVAELAAQSSGRLLAVLANIGDRVEAGDLLARVDAAETRRLLNEALAQAKVAEATWRKITVQLDAVRLEVERGESLEAKGLLSRQEGTQLRSQLQVQQAELAAAEAQRAAAVARVALYREQIGQAEIRAPFAGAVAERYLDPGSSVQSGTAVLRLVEQGPLRVRFRASEEHVGRLTQGAPLTVTTLATGEQRHPGKIERISAEVSRTDRTIAVEGVLDSEVTNLRPGMYANVVVELGTLRDAILIPGAALLARVSSEGKREEGVFVAVGDRAEYRQVAVVGKHGELAAVRELDRTLRVVVFGQETLRAGDPIKIVEPAAP